MRKKLYVGNLSFDTTENSLTEAFSRNDRRVRDVAIITDRETGRSRGFGFVEMDSEEDARSAMAALDGSVLDGRTLRVNEAQERRPRTDGGRGGRW